MPPKTKTQLKEELEQARRELAEAKARIETEAAEASSAAEERARETKRELTKELQSTRRERDEVKRDLTEATEELATAQEKIRELELRLEEERTAPGAGATPSSEVGVVLVGELEEARDEALEALDRTQWEMERLKREHELQLLQVKESLREELEKKYERDLKTRDELIELMRGKKRRDVVPEVRGAGAQSSGGGSPEPESLGESTWGAGNRLKLPTLPKFTGEDRDDVDSLRRWIAKLEKHAELQKWTDREKLVQFELHLAGRAERVYEVLPSTSKVSFKVATGALQKRLNPVEREALVSAQLMRRKQQTGESVDEFAQDLDNLFDRSYGRRAGMDEGSKEMLKRDFFVQSLLLKWQEKVLPSAKTFSDALHQARAAEQQERQLIKLHQSGGSVKAGTSSKPSASAKAASGSASQSGERPESSASSTSGRGRLPGGCFECGSRSHRWRDCPKLKPPRETPGKRSVPKATNSAINASQETLGDKCARLQKAWIDAEFVRLSQSYETVGEVDHVAGAVGPLYFGTVSIAGEPVEAMVDTGSSATILSFDLFKQIGKKANIPVSALSTPDVVLRDYNQRPIPVGAKVELEFSFNGKQVTAPVYLRGSGSAESEACLLGTNVIVPLGMVSPAEGVAPRGGHKTTVRLVREQRIPSQKGAWVEAQLDRRVPESAVLFEPRTDWSHSGGMELTTSLVCPDQEGKVLIPVRNPTKDTLKVAPGEVIGSVDAFEVEKDAEPESVPVSFRDGVVVSRVVSLTGGERCTKLAKLLKEGKEEVNQLILNCALDFNDVFALDDRELGEAKAVEHVIDTGDSQPIRQLPRRVPFALRKEISRLVQEMLDGDIIQESASPWASPVVLVRKKDGSLRFCIDYRRLNAVTRKDTFPLPRIDDLLDQLSGKTVFSTLDAKRGYWQIRVQAESQEKTAFTTFDGLYEFKVMPFGLCNAPSTFQRLMQRTLRGMSHFCNAYIDDVLVFSDTVEEHIEHLRVVLQRLRDVGIKLHPQKCSLGRSTVPYLGHIVSSQGIFPDHEKIAAVEKFPTPTNVRSVREFLGLASYYRRFVPNFAKVAGPLHMLTRADVPFVWTDACEKAFVHLKGLLTSPPVLAYPDFAKPFVLHTDASRKGLGAVLEQVQDDGSHHPVAFASRTLSKHEAKYGITELETLAVIWSLRHFRAYLYGHKCTVYTDHSPVTSLLKTKHSSGKLARWGETVAEFDLEVKYRPGRKNANADALSRSPIEDGESESYCPQVAAISCEQPKEVTQDVGKLQSQDAELGPIVVFLEQNILPREEQLARRLTLERSHYTLVDGVLHRIDDARKGRLRLCVPREMRELLMQEAHAGVFAGHFSSNSVYNKLARYYWWDGMYRDVHAHCRSCLTCASYQGTGRRVKPQLMSIPVGGPFHRVGVDIMELPLTSNGNKYVISFVDYLTKWVESFPSDNQTSETIVRLLVDHVICRHGVPEVLVSDRGANLLSTLMKEVSEVMGMKKVNTTAYHPQTDGLVENFNRSLQAMVAKSVDTFGTDWDEYLPHLLFAYRTRPHDSTGESPFFLLYGRDARLPTELALSAKRTPYQVDLDDYRTELVHSLSEAWRIARESVAKAQKRQKKAYDKHSRPRSFREGDRVMVYMPVERNGRNRKLSRPYFGPYRVLEVHPNGLTVRPVDRITEPSIRVNQDRVTICPKELPDKSWLGRRRTSRRGRQN